MEAMRVASACIANYAEIRNGIVNILGGYPEWWEVPQLPQQATMFIVVTCEMDHSEAGRTFSFDLKLKRPSGDDPQLLAQIQTVKPPSPAPTGASLKNPIVVPAPVNLGEEGLHEFQLTRTDSGDMFASVSVWVRLNPGLTKPPL
jgi:hypothetical protein